jgi:O-antigen ligase
MVPGVLLFAAFVLTAPSRKTLDRIQVAFVLLLLFFIVYVRTVGTAFTGRLRSVGLFSDPNDLASVIATAVPFAMAVVMRTHRPRDRAAAGLALVLLIVSLVATGSRGGTLALAAGATVFALGMRGERGFVMILLMVAGGVAAWSTAPASFKDRMLSLTSLETDYNTTSDSGRKAVWRRGRLYFRQNPILGVGAGNFATAEGAYKEETGGSGKWSAPHNAYVEAFAELGVVGGGTFVLLLLTAAKLSLPMWRPPSRRGRGPPALYRPEFLSSLAAFSTGAVFLSHAYFLPLFGVLGFIALADRTSRAEMQGGGELGAQPLATRARVRVPGQRGRLAFVRDYADLHAPATFGMGLELPAARRGGRGGTSAERE